jgi:myo-inositol-1(or 4)-monophosphatase
VADDLLGAVAGIAAEAGQMALARWRGPVASHNKADGSPVCEVDLDVDRMLRARLTALVPEAGWLSEETADSAERLHHARVWVVDPIDGTRDFLRSRAGWCVSVALVEAGRPVLAVLDAPALGQAWRAAAGAGAWRDGERLRVSHRTDLAGARVPADALPKADRDFVTVPKPNSIALRIAMVAAGEADLVATLRWGNEWDIAAAALVASEAGATVTDAHGTPLVFKCPRPQAFGVLVAAPGIHAAAVARLEGRAKAAMGTA